MNSMLDDMITNFIAENPEIPDSAIDWVERFAAYQEINGMGVDLNEGLIAANDGLRTILDAVQATRIAADGRGHYEESWLNKSESERLKSEFFKHFNSIFGANIPHVSDGN